ncbi:MAG: cupin domain-containing protein [Candidatus Levybacteria bacterium]|nr:cupin domain-containing protein [Candidatus Levybacteria bacterium]
MKIYNLNSKISIQKVDSYVKNAIMIFADKDNVWEGKIKYKCTNYCDVCFLKLKADEIIPKHKHSTSEEIALVIYGDGFVQDSKKHKRIQKDDLIFLEKDRPHGYTAGEKGLNLLVFHALPMHDRMLVR